MAKFLSVLWVAAVSFAMILALLLLTGGLRNLSLLGPPAKGLPWLLGCILLSGVTVIYSATELLRRFFKRRPFLPRVVGIAVIFPALATSILLAAGSMPRGSVDTRIIPALALSQADLFNRAISELNNAKTEEERFHALGAAAKTSFVAGKIDDARKYAEELRTLAPKFASDWNYGNAIQNSNLVLGRIAVRENRIDDAKRYLIEAGKSPGSPQMDSFGPNMSLAQDLLVIGEKEVVLQYFELCRNFWSPGRKELDQWSSDVRDGQIPDFGANLVY